MRTYVFFILTCLLASLVPLIPKSDSREEYAAFAGWPTHFAGRQLRLLPLSQGELLFSSEFPGRIGRFSDGRREIAMRWIAEPTRRLHQVSDCLIGAGYDVSPQPIYRDDEGLKWGSVLARRNDQVVLARERIHDDNGNSYTDVSAWYWAAVLGQTTGPWWAITVVERQ